MLADAVISFEITIEGLAIAQLVGDNTAITQHAAIVHRVLQHLLWQAVETSHRIGRTLETECLRQRKIQIEQGDGIVLDIDVLQRATEELLTHLWLETPVIEESHTHVREVEILHQIALFDVIGEAVNLNEGTMEPTIIHLIYHAIHPRTIVFIPILTILQILHEGLMSLVEVRVAAILLRLIKPLHKSMLLCVWLLFLLSRLLLLSA